MKFIVISKAWLTQILKTKNPAKNQCHQSCVNTICKSIRVTILTIFRFVRKQMVSPKKVHVQTTWKIAQAVIKLVTEVVRDMCDNWTVSFCNIFGQESVFIFYWYLRSGKNVFWLFDGWMRKVFTSFYKKNISPRSPPQKWRSLS